MSVVAVVAVTVLWSHWLVVAAAVTGAGQRHPRCPRHHVYLGCLVLKPQIKIFIINIATFERLVTDILCRVSMQSLQTITIRLVNSVSRLTFYLIRPIGPRPIVLVGNTV